MIVHRSPLPDVEIPATTVTEHVLREANRVPDRPAFIDGPSGRTYTYAQFAGAVRAFAGGLQARGLGPGSTIALMSPNIPEFAIVFHGAATAGVAVSTINPTYTAEEVNFQLRDSGSTMLITIAMFAETAVEAAAASQVDEIVIMGEAPEGMVPFSARTHSRSKTVRSSSLFCRSSTSTACRS